MDKFAPLFVDGRIDCICGFVLLFIICQRAWSLTRGALELMVVFPRSSEKYLGKIIMIEEKFYFYFLHDTDTNTIKTIN